MQQAKQPFCTRLQLRARLALNAGKHTGNQPTRLAHLDDGNDCAILVQGDEGPAQSLPWRKPGSFGWGIGALHRLATATMVPSPRRLPHSISRSHPTAAAAPDMICAGHFGARRDHLVQALEVLCGRFRALLLEPTSAPRVAAQIR